MESWRGEKMSEVEIILVEIVVLVDILVDISALYYRFNTISIVQVRKLVVQVSYKYKYKLQELKNRPQGREKARFRLKIDHIV